MWMKQKCGLSIFTEILLSTSPLTNSNSRKGKDTSFIPPRRGAGCWGFPEPFQPHGWEDSGWIRWGWVRKEGGRYWEVDTDPAFALSVIWDIPRCDGVEKSLKKTHTWSGCTGVRTRDLPNVKWRVRRLATVLNIFQSSASFIINFSVLWMSDWLTDRHYFFHFVNTHFLVWNNNFLPQDRWLLIITKY
jgi:hypothetical protein